MKDESLPLPEDLRETPALPILQHVVCTTCGGIGVAEVGKPVLCQECVNQFLAQNVGTMQPLHKAEEPLNEQ